MNADKVFDFMLTPDTPDLTGPECVRVWLAYRSGEGVADPDDGAEARSLYKELWLEKLGVDYRPEEDYKNGSEPQKYVQGDWMCSVWTTLKKALQQTCEESPWSEKEHIENTFDDGCVTQDTFKGILRHFDEFEEFKSPTVWKFIRAAYTRANLIIVPDGFNVRRSRGTQDYWDKTLKKFYENYASLKDVTYAKPFRDLIDESNRQGDLLILEPWLKDGKARMMPGHYLDNKGQSWQELMKEMTARIERRGQIMQQRLSAGD